MGLLAIDTRPTPDGLRATQAAFIAAFIESGSMSKSSEAVGLSLITPYDWCRAEGTNVRDESPPEGTFAHALLCAKEIAADRILERSEEHARSQSYDMPATVNRMFHIKRWYPQYRDQLTVKSTSINLTARVDLNQLDTSERLELLSLTKRRMELLTQQAGNVADGTADVGDGGG